MASGMPDASGNLSPTETIQSNNCLVTVMLKATVTAHGYRTGQHMLYLRCHY